MKKAFLLAHPARHSLSPLMHNAAFKALGVEAEYRALDVPPEQLAEVVASLRQNDVYGANVTVPHKLAVMPFLDGLSEAAQAVGAVNSIINQNGRLLGHNTDASGFIRALQEDGGFVPAGKKTVVLGAGGAARAIVYALLKAGVASLAIYNRSSEKALILAKVFAPLGDMKALEAAELATAVRNCDLLVNTTSVGMEQHGLDPNESPLEAGLLPEHAFVCDIVYRPAKTRLLREAEAAGLNTQNGLPMLAYQGAEAFECWTGYKAPTSLLLEALSKALAGPKKLNR